MGQAQTQTLVAGRNDVDGVTDIGYVACNFGSARPSAKKGLNLGQSEREVENLVVRIIIIFKCALKLRFNIGKHIN